MKKVLLASSVLALSAGFAAAEITFSGSAVMGFGDNESSDVYTIMETYLTASASGETDGGLSFGYEFTIATYSTDDDVYNDGTSVYLSGAFGKLSMGSVAEADEVGTLSDIGLVGVGVDNIAESFSGDSFGRATHDVNYTYSGGPLTLGLSTSIQSDGTGDGYALGVKYAFGDAYVGLGYNDSQEGGFQDGTVVSVYAGGTFGAVGVKAMYSQFNSDFSSTNYAAYGVHVAYTADALTVSAEFAAEDYNDTEGYGLGVAYDLGGGAEVVAGVGNVADETKWDMGLSFSF